MGLVYAAVELINSEDLEIVHRHIIVEEEVNPFRLSTLANSAAYMMSINETI